MRVGNAVLFCLAILGTKVAPAGIMDQKQESASQLARYDLLNNAYDNGNHFAMWQSFTAGAHRQAEC